MTTKSNDQIQFRILTRVWDWIGAGCRSEEELRTKLIALSSTDPEVREYLISRGVQKIVEEAEEAENAA